MECTHIKQNGSKCTANAMLDSKFCCFHDPDKTEDEKYLIRSEAGSMSSRRDFIESPLPEIKIEKMSDVVFLLADTINCMRTGKISQKSGSSFAYLSFILLMAIDKAGSETKRDNIEKQKAEGTWRPEPRYAPKFYVYKDEFFLDKDGNHLIVEKDGSTFRPQLDYKPEYPVIKRKSKPRRDASVTRLKTCDTIAKPVTRLKTCDSPAKPVTRLKTCDNAKPGTSLNIDDISKFDETSQKPDNTS